MVLEYFNIVFGFAVVMLLFSLVITVMVQIVVVVGGLRSSNLLWAVTKVLDRIPGLQKHAAEIAEKALQHPAIISTGKKAKVIGLKELLAVLYDLTGSSNTSLKEKTKEKLNEVLRSAVPQESQYHAEKLAKEFKSLFPNESVKMDEAMNLFQQKAGKLASDFNTWFDTIMNRSTDRFVKNTRIWTVVFAVLLAFGLQINSFDLLKNLSTDAELRAGLIQMADQALTRADEVLFTKSITLETLELISQNFEDFKNKNIPTSLVTRSQGLGWLTDQFKDSLEFAKIKKAYKETFDKLIPQRLGKLGEQMYGLKDELEASRLVIFPENRSIYIDGWKLENLWKQLPGILLSLILLSFGAPFWFNALRTLTSLRPIMAGKTDPSKSDKK
jgi:hypothetical protein